MRNSPTGRTTGPQPGDVATALPWALAVGALAALWPATHGWIALLVAMSSLAVSGALVAGTVFDITVSQPPARPPRLHRVEVDRGGRGRSPRHPWAA